MTLPLADVRILSVEQFGAGPWARCSSPTSVPRSIKIEDPDGGRRRRRYVPPFRRARTRCSSSRSTAARRASRSTSAPRAAAVSTTWCGSRRRLLQPARRPPEKLGLTYAELARSTRDRLLLAVGVRQHRPARGRGRLRLHDPGARGLASLTGGPDEPPMKCGLSVVDFAGGYARRSRSWPGLARAARRRGGDSDMSLFETALAQLTYVGTWAASRDYGPAARGSRRICRSSPSRPSEAADGWLASRREGEVLGALLDALGPRDLAGDPRSPTFADRGENRDGARAGRGSPPSSASAPPTSGSTRCGEARIPAQPVNDPRGRARGPAGARPRRASPRSSTRPSARSATCASPLGASRRARSRSPAGRFAASTPRRC